jgi:hypothetical protein
MRSPTRNVLPPDVTWKSIENAAAFLGTVKERVEPTRAVPVVPHETGKLALERTAPEASSHSTLAVTLTFDGVRPSRSA